MRSPKILRRRLPRAVTLLELVVVLVVLVALAAMIIPQVTSTADQARESVTRATLRELQDVIANRYMLHMRGVIGSLSDENQEAILYGLPGPNSSNSGGRSGSGPQLCFLFQRPNDVPQYDSLTGRGWNGPYLLNNATYQIQDEFVATFGENGDPTVFDGWGNPIIIDFARDSNGTPLRDSSTNMLIVQLVSAGPDGKLSTSDPDYTVRLQ